MGTMQKKCRKRKKVNEVKERHLKFSLSMNAKNLLKKGSQPTSIHIRTIGIRSSTKST